MQHVQMNEELFSGGKPFKTLSRQNLGRCETIFFSLEKKIAKDKSDVKDFPLKIYLNIYGRGGQRATNFCSPQTFLSFEKKTCKNKNNAKIFRKMSDFSLNKYLKMITKG